MDSIYTTKRDALRVAGLSSARKQHNHYRVPVNMDEVLRERAIQAINTCGNSFPDIINLIYIIGLEEQDSDSNDSSALDYLALLNRYPKAMIAICYNLVAALITARLMTLGAVCEQLLYLYDSLV